MQEISLDAADGVTEVAELLRRDGVVIMPTDTLYGFHGALSSQAAYQRILSYKADVSGRRYLTLAASVDMVDDYVASWGCTTREDMMAVWPSALTAVLHADASRCPAWVGDTLAIRVPDAPELCRVIEMLGMPLMSTSVNVSGEPSMDDRDAIAGAFGDCVDALVRRDDEAGGAASTLVDFTGAKPAVLRRGGFLWG